MLRGRQISTSSLWGFGLKEEAVAFQLASRELCSRQSAIKHFIRLGRGWDANLNSVSCQYPSTGTTQTSYVRLPVLQYITTLYALYNSSTPKKSISVEKHYSKCLNRTSALSLAANQTWTAFCPGATVNCQEQFSVAKMQNILFAFLLLQWGLHSMFILSSLSQKVRQISPRLTLLSHTHAEQCNQSACTERAAVMRRQLNLQEWKMKNLVSWWAEGFAEKRTNRRKKERQVTPSSRGPLE